MNTLTINRLPSRTWNFLRVNETALSWDEAQTADLGAERPDGATVAMTFHFPKGYAASLKGCRVSFGGRDYPVIGDPQPFPSENCPTPWAMAVECEACDG